MISSLRHMIQHNLAAKIVALVVAVVLWGYVMNDQNPAIEGTYNVQIKLKNVPEGYKISQENTTVKIKVRGARSLFVSTNSEDFKAYVDLKDAENGKKSYKVQVEPPQGFEVVDEKPSTVEVTLDRIIERKVRAIVNVNGAPAPGVAVAKVSQASSDVVVEGPESAVNEVERVIGYIGLTGRNDSDFDIQVPLTAINADGREVQDVVVKPVKMFVTVQMARGLMKKIVTVQAAFADDLGKGYDFVGSKVDPLKIELAGNEKVISAVDTLTTEKISLADVTGNTDRTVKLVLPEGIAVTNQEVVVHILVREKKKE